MSTLALAPPSPLLSSLALPGPVPPAAAPVLPAPAPAPAGARPTSDGLIGASAELPGPAIGAPAAAGTDLSSIASPALWAVTVALVLALVAVDFALTRRPHEVSTREALGWTVFYLALPLAFGAFVWSRYGTERGVQYLTGYLVEKSLSVDNLFVFMLLLGAFAVPTALRQRVLLYGIVGALALRAVFIALGAAALKTVDWAFLVFGAVLLVTAVKIARDALAGHQPEVDVSALRSVRLLRRFVPVTGDYRGTRLSVREQGRRWLTPLAVVVIAVFTTDVVFAVDSVPAVYGITEDPYLVFATNAFALLGLRALYFVLQRALAKLVHLNHGLALILGFIGVKLALHWAHGTWSAVPQIPTLLSLGVIVATLLTVTATSLSANRRAAARAGDGHPRAGAGH